MSRIRSVNTKPELLVRKFLFAKGIRFRLHSKRLAGKPDIVISKLKSVIFINGCFWHGHKNCKYAKTPATNRIFWIDKISKNSLRDTKNIRFLKKDGWNVIVIWECQLQPPKAEKTFSKLLDKLSKKD